jgi:hypothetical protein
VVGTHHNLAVGPLAQRPTVLTSDSHGGFALLGKGGVVQHEEDAAFGTLLAQGPHASAIELEGVPIGIGEQVLEALGGGSVEVPASAAAMVSQFLRSRSVRSPVT